MWLILYIHICALKHQHLFVLTSHFGHKQRNSIYIPTVDFSTTYRNARYNCAFPLKLFHLLQLLNDVTGKIDPKQACKSALKLHSKYLRKVGLFFSSLIAAGISM